MVQACPGGDGEPWKVLESRSHRVYERHILFLKPGLEKGADRGHSRVAQRDRQAVVMEEDPGARPPQRSSSGQWVRWAQGHAGARSPGPGDLASLCVLRHTAWPLHCLLICQVGPPESSVLRTGLS